MAMMSFSGYISETGELVLDLPKNLPPGKVQVMITTEDSVPTNPKTGAEIIALLEANKAWWLDEERDGVAWVAEVRRKAAEARHISW